MPLTAGIVGLPNVGKSTLFNAITKSQVEAANYPFATIDPNVGVVEVPDQRLWKLSEIYQPKKTIPTTFEFTDIAGIVKGASKGEGLGNKFLANIREVDAICHVVRCFDDGNITHVSGGINPKDDIETINLELVLADLESVNKRYEKAVKMAKSKDHDAVTEANTLKKLKDALEAGKPARTVDFNEEEEAVAKQLFLLTMKPVLYVANVSEDDASEGNNDYVDQVRQLAQAEGSEVVVVSAKLEEDLATMDEEDRDMFLEDLGMDQSGLDVLIQQAYKLLGLATYFTAGEQEVRAWTFKKGMHAPQAAGIIHSDFERGFIRAETVHYDDLVAYGSIQACKEAGRYRSEGKDYEVQDGDVMLFRFNV
ncbi:redox-regulated ATPase YchF [Aerococcus loyolae]|uniref:Ribosome-binding ATPase YchF n=1 Tax=Aerococcus urinae TaxID=1376 RepID=A0A2I1L6T6_9LACT|nr:MULTISPECIES: redox-regulated ATPase YchF [Aerococcus]MCY3067866.1 redox-regulated ATPase YchF [Aerococcus mictus]MCY3080679.1 redox-regulated ATPase YchF [Aerococcus mictus]MDK6727907.1 redox-regulated ATPase YchF [Aerococcus urinae]MDK7910365.1 redox-regulated ATPase YchF [Aerococcus urinae]MDK8610076.1 redox-regulated ATPase YchF [Aerococcus urinae]